MSFHVSKLYRYAGLFVEDGHKSRRRIEKRLSECAIRHDTMMTNDATSARISWMRSVLTKSRRRDPSWGLLLISDDAAICGTPMISDMPPDDWDILYFGGRVDIVKEHTTEHWKYGLFRDAKFVIVRMKHVRALERALSEHHERDWDWVLHNMGSSWKTYCYSPQFVGSYRSMADKQTGIYHMEETPKSYDIVSLEDTWDEPHVHILCPTRGMHTEYHDALWEFLLFQYIRQSRNDKNVTLHVDMIWDDMLERLGNRVVCHEIDNTVSTYGAALNRMMDDILPVKDTSESVSSEDEIDKSDVFVIWKPGYCYVSDYLKRVRSCPKMLCGASRVVLYEVCTQKSSWFVPTDVNGHEIILDPALCVWKSCTNARFSDADVANPILTFAKDVGFENIGSYGDKMYGFRIVSAMSEDDRAKMMEGAPEISFSDVMTKQFFEDTCSGLSVVG